MAKANRNVTPQSSATAIPNAPGFDPAIRYSEAMKSIDRALGHFFSLWPDRDIMGQRDVDPHDIRLSPDYLMPRINMQGDIVAQVLDALEEMRDTITEAETLFRAAVDADELDLRPIKGYVAAVDCVPICEPTDEHSATMLALSKSGAAELVAVFEDGSETVVESYEAAGVEGGDAC